MEIKNLSQNLQYAKIAAEWAYKEFIENKRNDIDFEYVYNAFKNRKNSSLPMTLIAIEANKCIGMVTLFENDLKTRPDLTPWLGALYVEVSSRNKKVAQELIQNLLDIANVNGYKEVFLRTEHAAEYYEKRGWHFQFETVDEVGVETKVYKKRLY